MSRRQQHPLRPLARAEHATLTQISRAQSEPAAQVARAKALLAVAAGQSYTAAAQTAGRRSGDAVSHLVARFNEVGVAAVQPGHGGGQRQRYGVAEHERILVELRRTPDRVDDGTATWSLSTLQHALRAAPDGLPTVSTYTLWWVMHDLGWSWQRGRSWCETGTAVRRRKKKEVTVHDPDTVPKKTHRASVSPG